MLDIKLIREQPELVKENIRKKFQEDKLPLVDQVLALDLENRQVITEASELRASRNSLSKQIGVLMGQAKKDPEKLPQAQALKEQVASQAQRLAQLEQREQQLQEEIRRIMLLIPQILDPRVPIGRDDRENVEVERFGEPVVPPFPVPYHAEIMERLDGLDLTAARLLRSIIVLLF